MKLTPILKENVMEGDIIYVANPNEDQEVFGPDACVTGIDIIIIVDDIGEPDVWLINGGHEFYPEGATLYKIGHYSQILKQLP